MAVKFSMTVQGGAELAKRLEALSEALSKKMLVDALTAGGEPIRSRAATLAPRSKGPGPHLADHIVISAGRTGHTVAIGPSFAKVGAGLKEEALIKAANEAASRGVVGSEDYGVRGLMQEFGTVHHKAQAFLRPAFDALGRASLRIIEERLWAALRKQAGTTTDQTTVGQGRL